MMLRPVLLRVICAAVVAAAAAPALAQQLPPAQPGLPQATPQQPASRPSQALFGGGVGDTGQLLSVNFGLGGGHDRVLFPKDEPSRSFGNGNAALSYSVDRGRVTAGLSAGSSMRYYSSRSDFVGSYTASASIGVRVTEELSLSASQNLSVAPYNVQQFFPQSSIDSALWVDPVTNTLIDQGFSTTGGEYFHLGTNVSLSHQMFRRLSISAGYQRTQSGTDLSNLLPGYQAANVGSSFALAKGLGFRLGYGANLRGKQTTPGTYRGQNIDVGLDFNRALSLSRRATMSFRSGVVGLDDGVNRRYTLTGHAGLQYELGRSWTAALTVQRNAQFVASIETPLVAGGLTLGTSGLLTRRTQLNGHIGVNQGRTGITSTSPRFTASNASVGVNLALTRNLALGAQYSFYRYRFDSDAVLPVGVSPRRDRQSVSVRLNAWLPLIARSRRPNASR